MPSDDNVANLRCLLSKMEQDSHSHLFFDYSFSSQVWANPHYINNPVVDTKWHGMVETLKLLARRRLTRVVITKHLLN